MLFIVIILFGALASGFALVLELLVVSLFSFSDQTLFSSVPFAFGGAFSLKIFLILLSVAFVEESSKYLFLVQYKRRFSAAVQPLIQNPWLMGTLFGLGFALLETFFLLNTPTLPFSFALLGSIAVHVATSIAFAFFLFSSPQKTEPKKRRFNAFSLVSATILFHTLYNLGVLFFF